MLSLSISYFVTTKFLYFFFFSFFFLIASMKENSESDTLSQKIIFSQLSQKTPTECHLCNRVLKSKSGYTLHLKKCSQNVHVSQQNKAETIFPTTIAPLLPTSLPTIVSPCSITPTDKMTATSPIALTTVSTASTTSFTLTIITEVDVPPHHTDHGVIIF